jgi:peroxiredoxin-like protein
MKTKTFHYPAAVRHEQGKQGVLRLEGKPDLPVATPPEFGGPEGLTSPEDLYVASAAVCYMSTFAAVAERMELSFSDFSCEADGLLESVQGEGMLFTHIELRPKVTVAPDMAETAQKALEKAKKHCLVTNSMKTDVTLVTDVKTT